MSPSIPIQHAGLRTPVQAPSLGSASVPIALVALVVAAMAALVLAFPGSDTGRPASGRFAVPGHLTGVTRGGPVRAPLTRVDGRPRATSSVAATSPSEFTASLAAERRPATPPSEFTASLAAERGHQAATPSEFAASLAAERHHHGG